MANGNASDNATVSMGQLKEALREVVPTAPGPVWVVSLIEGETAGPVAAFRDRTQAEDHAENLGQPAETRQVELHP